MAGRVFDDANGSGAFDAGETGLGGWAVYLDADGDRRRDADEPAAATAADGTYTITGAVPGVYVVRQERPDGWSLNQPSSGGHALGVTTGSESFAGRDFANVRQTMPNTPPALTGDPALTATAGAPYAAAFTAIDADGDAVAFDLPLRPAGMTIDPATGAIDWEPRANQAGTARVLVRASDGRGGVDLFSYRIEVVAPAVPPVPPNTPPRITSSGPPAATAGRPYAYAVRAEDDEGDALTFSLVTPPDGMAIDAAVGLVSWVPTASQASGSPYLVSVKVSEIDHPGYWYQQNYEVRVSAAQPNRVPLFAPAEVPPGLVGAAYSLLLTATDPDGDALNYTITDQPGGAAGSASVNPATGAFAWTPGAVGTYWFSVRASDGSLAATYRFAVPVRAANSAPVVEAAGAMAVSKGAEFRFDALATDADGDFLTYAVTGLPGATVDDFGRVRWATPAAQEKSYSFTVTATDPLGAQGQRAFTVTVEADTAPPAVAVTADRDEVNVGQVVAFTVVATDNVRVASRTLSVTLNGVTTVVALDAGGVGRYTAGSAGSISATATATDAAGNVSAPAGTSVAVIDPTVGRPLITLTAPGGEVFAPSAVLGSVQPTGSGALDWKLDYLAAEGGWVQFAQGTGAVAAGQSLGTFDPTLLANGDYTLRLRARQNGGAYAAATLGVLVNGRLKLGNLTLSATDLTIPVAGIPITVTRVYDSLDVGKKSDFGPGWRLELGGYSVEVDDTTLGYSGEFRAGTRVTLRASDGTLSPFEFAPVPTGSFSNAYLPRFRPVGPTVLQLIVDEGHLLLSDGGGSFTSTESVDALYKRRDIGVFEVREPSGVKYGVDAKTGQFVRAEDRNGNELTFTEDGVFSNRGREVLFERDKTEQERITALVDPRGNRVRYAYDEHGDLRAVTDRAGVTAATYAYRPDPAHYLESVTDALGTRQLAASYDPVSQRLVGLSDAAGETASFAYGLAAPGVGGAARATVTTTVPDAGPGGQAAVSSASLDARGNPVSATDAAGLSTSAEYGNPALPDAPTRTVQVIGAADTAANGERDDLVTEVRYDSKSGLPVETRGPFSAATPLSERPASFVSYNTLALPEVTADALGNATRMGYDSKGNLSFTSSPSGVAGSFAYDGQGNLKSATRGGVTTSLDYFETGDVRRSTDAAGNKSAFEYDLNGNRQATTRVWTDPLDASHTVTLSSTVSYDGNDRPVATTDELGLTSATEYDRLGRAYKSIDPRGNVSVTLYDKRGLAVESRSPDGTVTRTAYDAQGRAVLSTDAFVPGQAEPVRGTETVYDLAGRVTGTRRREEVVIAVSAGRAGPSSGEAAVDSLGSVLSSSSTEYDSAGRAFRSTQFVGIAGAEAVSTTFYDTLGRAVGSQDALGRETKTAYDKAGRAVTSWDAAGVPTVTKYDADGRAVRTTYADGSFTEVGYDGDGRQAFSVDAVGQRTDSGYDGLGRLKTVTQPAVVNPATGQLTRPVTTYGTDDYGNRVSITDANGRVTAWAFDEHSRQVSRQLPAVPGEPAARETMAYDEYGAVDYSIDFNGTEVDTVYDYDANSGLGTKLGRVARVEYTRVGQSQPEQVVSYGYDALGRVDVVTESAAGRPDRVTATGYDVEGRAVKITRPEGVIEYAYDQVTGRHTKTWTGASEWGYDYDLLGRLAGVTEAARAGVTLSAGDRLSTAYGYDLVGMAKSVTVSRGGVAVRATANSYDPLRHWLVGVENKGEGGVALSSFGYARRADGQVETATESVMQPGGGAVAGLTKYAYDGLNRLASETYDGSAAGADYVKTYALDLVGNRTKLVTAAEGQAAVTTVSGYDERDRLKTESTGGVGTGYGYDANGSQTTKTVGGVVVSTQDWDARGRLASATVAGKSVSYSYTEGGIRSGVSEGGVATGYVIDGMSVSGYSQVVEEWSSGAGGSPVLLASFTYGAGLDPIATNTDTDGVAGTLEIVLFVADGHSGVRQAVATAGGAVLLAQRFDAYGMAAAMASVGGFAIPIGYRGERFDATLGQYNLRARLYDPRSGRFTNTDPFGGTYGDPLQAMRYGYAGANPVMNGDPSGMSLIGSFAGFAGRALFVPTTTWGQFASRAAFGLISAIYQESVLRWYVIPSAASLRQLSKTLASNSVQAASNINTMLTFARNNPAVQAAAPGFANDVNRKVTAATLLNGSRHAEQLAGELEESVFKKRVVYTVGGIIAPQLAGGHANAVITVATTLDMYLKFTEVISAASSLMTDLGEIGVHIDKASGVCKFVTFQLDPATDIDTVNGFFAAAGGGNVGSMLSSITTLFLSLKLQYGDVVKAGTR